MIERGRIERLLAAVQKDGRARVDLEACTISAGETSLSFAQNLLGKMRSLFGISERKPSVNA